MQSRSRLLFLALYLIPLSGVGVDLYSPSLPDIASDLNSPASLVKFTLAIYLFGFSIGQLIFGTLSDIHGRKPLLIISLVIFCIASYLATLTHNIYWLLLLRTVQGFSAAGPSVISKTLLTDTMSGADLKKASIYLVTVWGLGPIIAPAIGGYLQHYFGWRSNFYFFALYSFSMLTLILTLLKETNLNPHEAKWERIFKNYLTILSHPAFLANVFCMGLAYSIVMVFNIFTPFLVQNILGYSAITYGHSAMLVGMGFLIGSLSNRWLMARHDTQLLNRICVSLLLLITVTATVLPYFITMSLISLVVPIFCIVIFTGLLQTNLMSHTLSLFPNMGGAASATYGAILCFIAALVTTVGSLIHHITNQMTASWFYMIIVVLYCLTYWLVLDKAHKI